MTLRLVKDGEPVANPEIAEAWAAAKERGDKLLAEGQLGGLWLLLDAGEDSAAYIAGDDPVAMLWAVKRAAENGIDLAVFGES